MTRFRTHLVPAVCAHVERRGVDPAALVRSAGLPADAPARPWVELPLARLHAFLDEAARLARDATLGLNVGIALSRSTWDVIQVSFLSAPTLGAALHRIARLAPLFNDRATLVTRAGDEHVELEYRIEGEPLALGRHGNELILALLLARGRAATGERVVPAACWVAHARPRDPAPLQAFIGAPVTYGAGATGLRLRRRDADLPLRTADPVLLDVIDRLTEASLAPIRERRGTAAAVARVLTDRMDGSVPAISATARALAMSVRSVQRALGDEGTSYRALVDQVRRLKARELLGAGLAAGQVAARLGYADRSAFVRAMRRWGGGDG